MRDLSNWRTENTDRLSEKSRRERERDTGREKEEVLSGQSEPQATRASSGHQKKKICCLFKFTKTTDRTLKTRRKLQRDSIQKQLRRDCK